MSEMSRRTTTCQRVFELMLDDTMTYSCGVFERPDASLRDAQLPRSTVSVPSSTLAGDHLVEIGSGWAASPSTRPIAMVR